VEGVARMGDSRTASGDVVNALTVDVADYFHDPALSAHVPRTTWETLPSRVELNVERVLDLLGEHDTRATFFALGWIAERYPNLVRRIVDAGHELASHGYDHVSAIHQGWGQFLADIRLAKAILEDISGVRVSGYRDPGLSIGPANAWVFECIVEAGYRYSSSVYPTGRNLGALVALRFAHEVRPGLIEVPLSTVRMLGANWPAGGADYFRLLPYGISRWSIRRINDVEDQPAMFHFHPWDLDPDQPRLRGPGPYARFRNLANRERMDARLRRLLTDFRWDRTDRAILAVSP
jgi:polysaccharide deacetylase family protein (PEP-CTERM system associated)